MRIRLVFISLPIHEKSLIKRKEICGKDHTSLLGGFKTILLSVLQYRVSVNVTLCITGHGLTGEETERPTRPNLGYRGEK